jgi:hypothetical protein
LTNIKKGAVCANNTVFPLFLRKNMSTFAKDLRKQAAQR